MGLIEKLVATINWDAFKYNPKDTCHCVCGETYLSHTKSVVFEEEKITVSKEYCPVCGKHDKLVKVEKGE